MDLLLDTHVFLWWITDDPRLAGKSREAITHADVVLISAASAWEIAIKHALGRITLATSFVQLVDNSGFDELPIQLRHAEEVRDLPHHHRDPFDRMLVAQARVEGLTLVTHDQQLAAYNVTSLWD